MFVSDPRNTGEYNTSREHERRPQNIAKRRPEGTQTRIQDAPFRSIKPSSATEFDGSRRPLKLNTEQRMKTETVSVHKSEKPMIQSKPVVTEHKRKAPGPQQEVSVGTKSLCVLFALILDMELMVVFVLILGRNLKVLTQTQSSSLLRGNFKRATNTTRTVSFLFLSFYFEFFNTFLKHKN